MSSTTDHPSKKQASRRTLFVLVCGLVMNTGIGAKGLSTAEKTDEYFVDNARLKGDCDHIQILGENDRGKVPPDHRDLLLTPGKYQRKLVILALNELPEFVCKSVGKVAFYTHNPGGSGGSKGSGGVVYAKVKGSHPDLINIYVNGDRFSEQGISPTARAVTLENEYYFRLQVSYAEWPLIMKTVIHEAVHCAVYLLERQTSADLFPGAAPWRADVQQRAERIVKDAGLDEGFIKQWEQVHESFENLNWAAAFDEGAEDAMTQVPNKGFFSSYGQKDAWEDIAEIVALLTLNESGIRNLDFADELGYDNVLVKVGERAKPAPVEQSASRALLLQKISGWNDPCKPLKELGTVGVPSEWAAIYTKIMFLIDVELIDEEVYRRCAGNGGRPKLRFDYDRTDNGLHVVDYDTGNYMYSHRNISVGFPVSDSEAQVFTLLGEGTLNTDEGASYDTRMRLELHFAVKPALPRGVYTIPENLVQCPQGHTPDTLLTSIRPRPAPWTFTLSVPEAPSRGFCATGGIILVTRATRDFVEGSMIINTVLKRVGRMPIPERPNFKVYIRWTR